ncbi:hypothetical protein ACIP5Y_39165 [Nocardia sp. NPDC088792]|uniref:hypothetical protein n=1 Tax=Nocardia sp. NPDC088792 TaxID=3364332 RepID=UPI0037FDE6ED
MGESYDDFVPVPGSVDRVGGGGESRIFRHLRAGEQVLWLGGPDPGVRFTPADVFVIPFYLVWVAGWTAFLAWMIASGILIPLVVGVPSLCVGAYPLVGKFFLKGRLRRRTGYAVTTGRALIAEGTRTLREVPLPSLPMSIRHSRDGRHVSVAIGECGRWWMFADEIAAGKRVPAFAFYDVADPDGLLAALNNG